MKNACNSIRNPRRQLARMNARHVRKALRWHASGRWPTPATDKRAVGRAYDMLVAIACSERDEPHHWA